MSMKINETGRFEVVASKSFCFHNNWILSKTDTKLALPKFGSQQPFNPKICDSLTA